MRSSIEGVIRPFDGDPLLAYLHHVSIVFFGPIKLDNIFDYMEDKIVGRAPSLQFLEALANYASDYAAILNPADMRSGDNINSRLAFALIKFPKS